MYITKYGCVFLKLGESTIDNTDYVVSIIYKSTYMAMDLIPILLGSLPLAHNAQHSLVIGRAGASPPSRTTGPRCLYICIYVFMYIFIRGTWSMYQIPLISKCLYVNLF